MAQLIQRLPDADLYWMSRTAATVAMDMAERIPKLTYREMIATSELPTTGLMIWPKSLATLPWTNNRVDDPSAPAMDATWDGIAWVHDDQAFTSYLISRVEAQRAAGALSIDRPAWSPAQSVRLDSVSLDSLPGDGILLMPTAPPIPGMKAVPTVVGRGRDRALGPHRSAAHLDCQGDAQPAAHQFRAPRPRANGRPSRRTTAVHQRQIQ